MVTWAISREGHSLPSTRVPAPPRSTSCRRRSGSRPRLSTRAERAPLRLREALRERLPLVRGLR